MKALPGNPYDCHTLGKVLPDIEAQIGANISRIVADRGYRGYNAHLSTGSRSISPDRSGASPKRSSATSDDDRASSRASATSNPNTERGETISPAHAAGDATNAVLAAVGYNFRRLLAWLPLFLRLWFAAITAIELLPNLVGAA